MKIEVLYIQDCPGYAPALEIIKQVLAEEQITATLTGIEVTEANTPGFLGSPTIRINGKDIERGDASSDGTCGLACRTYLEAGNLQNVPSREVIRSAMRTTVR